MAQKGMQSTSSEYHFKFILLGECNTGKTAIMKLLCENTTVQAYKTTLGVEDGVYRDETEQGRFRVIVYDTSGQERFRKMSLTNLNSSQAVIFVYDVTNPETLKGVESRIKEVCEHKAAANIEKVLLGNRIDLLSADEPEKTKELALELASQHKLKRLECSAKDKASLVRVVYEVVNDLISIQILKSATTIDDDFGKPRSHTRENQSHTREKEEENRKSGLSGLAKNDTIQEELEQTKEDDTQRHSKNQNTTNTMHWKMQRTSEQEQKMQTACEQKEVVYEYNSETPDRRSDATVQRNRESEQNHKEDIHEPKEQKEVTQGQKEECHNQGHNDEVVNGQNDTIEHIESRNKSELVSMIEETHTRPVQFGIDGPQQSKSVGCNCNIF